MGILKWHKRDHNAALQGMMELTLEERGAYTTVLDLMYSCDGRLPDNDRSIASWLRVDIRRWQRIRKRLIEKGKLYPYAGELHNRKADEVIEIALRKVSLASASANKRWATYNEIKKLSDADAMRSHMRWQCDSESERKVLSARLVPTLKKPTDKKE